MCPEFNLVVLFCYFSVLLTQVVVLSVLARAVQIYEYVAAHNCGLLECLNFRVVTRKEAYYRINRIIVRVGI